ncbi:poly-beta-1,6 N-acetyl-D-glucosamine export porin PgaA [Aeromonas salmonicida]|uniref:Poly-beta-1,6 N-acetyl-D-glucosamine export porin PgaA n=1 Tax=Aeromonas salmonicida TaxID=645 RepID=A0AAX1PL11_AERSA|nr:poly-beta-1,6 N-acetyl-D-glucosamine export porin PgaA [Aeromonas salmonicida]RAJ07331.1 poly-beta-1,6 N-acetyl-D-glucosamine export porin PgaA [Aeromonas salmonicida]
MNRIFWLLALLPLLAFAGGVDSVREAWVIQARAGELDAAAQGLDALYRQTGDGKVLDDLIAVQLWRGDRKGALAACAPCEFSPIANSTLEGVARAARDEKRYFEAISYYRVLQGRDPGNPTGWLGLFLTASDQGNRVLAHQAAGEYEARFGRDRAVLEARIYAARQAEDPMGEMLARQQWLALEPGNSEQVLALYRVAVSLGAGPAAADLMGQYPALFKPVDRLWLDYYQAVNLLRISAQTEDPALARTSLTHTLALQDKILARAPRDHVLYLSARRDLVVTLVALGEFAQAERESAALQAEGPLPEYVQEARADALVGLGRVDEASLIYRQLATPQRAKDKTLLEKRFYAYSDAEHYGAAQGLLAGWQEPPTRWDFTGNMRMPNDDYEKVLQLRTLLLAWRGQAGQAEAQLEGWLKTAPANPWLWLQLGDIRRWRGHPDGAEQAYQQAVRWLPTGRTRLAEPGRLHARLDQGQWQQTPQAVRALGNLTKDRRELQQRLALEQAPMLTTELTHGRNEGGSVQASRDWSYDSRLYSARNDGGDRLFVRRQGSFGEFDQQSERAAYTGLGAEVSFYPLQLTLEGGSGSELNHKGYLWSRLDWRLGDRWTLGAAINLNSADTPLRALARGNYADQYQLDLGWRQDETREAGLRLERMDISDGNRRLTASGWLRQDLWRRDRWWFDTTLRAATSRNEAVAVDYFNPLRDRNLELELAGRYRLPLDGRRALLQSLVISGNQYWQQEYGGDPGWQLSYRHDWVFSPALSLGYGLGRRQAVYDGNPEYGNFVFANLQWSFM